MFLSHYLSGISKIKIKNHFFFIFLHSLTNKTRLLVETFSSLCLSDQKSLMASNSDDDFVILVCANLNPIEVEVAYDREILISTEDIQSWNLVAILRYQTVRIQAYRNRPVTFTSHLVFLGLDVQDLYILIIFWIYLWIKLFCLCVCRVTEQSSYFHGLLRGSFR